MRVGSRQSSCPPSTRQPQYALACRQSNIPPGTPRCHPSPVTRSTATSALAVSYSAALPATGSGIGQSAQTLLPAPSPHGPGVTPSSAGTPASCAGGASTAAPSAASEPPCRDD